MAEISYIRDEQCGHKILLDGRPVGDWIDDIHSLRKVVAWIESAIDDIQTVTVDTEGKRLVAFKQKRKQRGARQ